MSSTLEQTLLQLLEAIEPPPAGSDDFPRFRVEAIPGRDGQFVGRNSGKNPCILISSRNASHRAPIRLAALDVRYSVRCSIVNERGQESVSEFNVLVCTSNDRNVQRYFAYTAATLLNILGVEPSVDEIAESIQYLIELFQTLSQPTRKTVIGLIGELFVIYLSRRPDTAIRAWRSTTDDHYDFSIDNVRLEVKATSSRVRAHSLSLEQCHPPSGTTGILVSLFIESAGAGLSLVDLIRSIEGRIVANPTLQRKLTETVARTLGSALPAALDTTFDEQRARSSFSAYDLERVPAIRTNIPAELSQIRFVSNLTNVSPLDTREIEHRCSRMLDFLPP